MPKKSKKKNESNPCPMTRDTSDEQMKASRTGTRFAQTTVLLVGIHLFAFGCGKWVL